MQPLGGPIPSHFAILANDAVYDVVAAAAELREDRWLLPIGIASPGDLLAIWRTRDREGRRGVVAFAEVIEGPTPLELPPEALRFWRTSPAAGAQRAIRIRYLTAPRLPLWLDEDDSGLLASLAVSRAQGNKLYRLSEHQWASLASMAGLLRESEEPDDQETEDELEDIDDDATDETDEEAPLPPPANTPIPVPTDLYRDIAARRGFSIGGVEPASRRALDEPLVMAHNEWKEDRDADARDIEALIEGEAELVARVLTTSFATWERFVAQYQAGLKDQPPSAHASKALAALCAAALRRNRGGRQLLQLVERDVPRPVRARLHRWLRLHEPDHEHRALEESLTRLREQLVLRNVKLASWYSSRVFHEGLLWRPRLRLAVTGLVRALDSYEISGSASLPTYMAIWIKAYVTRAAHNYGRPGHRTNAIVDRRMKEAAALRSALARGESAPKATWITEADLSVHQGLPHAAPREVLEALEGASLPPPERRRQLTLAWDALMDAIEALPTERERNIIVLRLGLDGTKSRTLSEIGKQYGLSRERIRQLETVAKRQVWRKVRSALQSPESTTPTSSGSPNSST